MSLSNLGLDAFETIAETGTIVVASQKLGVTQTALTQRIKSLEAELEAALFTRSRRGMSLTAEGRLLYQYCQERRLREEQTIQKMKGGTSRESFRVRISGPTLQTQSRFLPELKAIKELAPYLYFTFDIDDSSDLFTKLKENIVDLVLTSSPPPPSLKSRKLSPSEFILVGPYEWRKRKIQDIIKNESIVDFNAHDPYTINFLKSQRLLPKFLPERMFINNTHQMLMMVEAGLGYAVFDRRHVQEMIEAKRLLHLLPQVSQKTDWYLCWNDHGNNLSSPLKLVVDQIK